MVKIVGNAILNYYCLLLLPAESGGVEFTYDAVRVEFLIEAEMLLQNHAATHHGQQFGQN